MNEQDQKIKELSNFLDSLEGNYYHRDYMLNESKYEELEDISICITIFITVFITLILRVKVIVITSKTICLLLEKISLYIGWYPFRINKPLWRNYDKIIFHFCKTKKKQKKCICFTKL